MVIEIKILTPKGLTNEEKEKLNLASESSAYVYLQGAKHFGTLSRKKSFKGTLSRSNTISKTGTAKNAVLSSDAEDLGVLRDHLKSLGIGKRLQSYIFQVLAGILHLGNIQFSQDPLKPQDPTFIKNADALTNAASLLGLTESTLEQTLLYKAKLIGKEFCSMILTQEEASVRRDDLARALYSLVFSWLMSKINDRLCKEESGVDNFISVLDFSSLVTIDGRNAPLEFYEFSSNLAYERVSQFMDSRTISARDSAFKAELLTPPTISFADHSPILNFLTGQGGLIACINEETCANQDAESISNTLNSQFTKNELYIPSSRCSQTAVSAEHFMFGIRHNFSRVEYSVDDFQSRNTETISSDFVAIFRNSVQPSDTENPDAINNMGEFMASLFSDRTGVETETKGGNIVSARVNATLKRNPSMKRKGKSGKKSAFATSDTALSNLVTSLDDLMVCVSNTKIYSVLCINPFEANARKMSLQLLRQYIEALSVPALAASRAYSNVSIPGMPFDAFEAQYGAVIAKYQALNAGIATAMDRIASANLWSPKEIMLGRTQIFLSDAKWRWFKNHSPSIIGAEDVRDSFIETTTALANPNRESRYDDDNFTDVESEYGGDIPRKGYGKDVEFGRPKAPVEQPKKEIIDSVSKVTGTRRTWVCITWLLTWWVPGPFLRWCGKMKRPDIRMAWREKVALCIIILLMNAALLFVIIGLRYLICPPLPIKSQDEVRDMARNGAYAWVGAQGRYYYIQDLVNQHLRTLGPESGNDGTTIARYQFDSILGNDVSYLFYKQDNWGRYCSLPAPQAGWDYLNPKDRTQESPPPKHRVNGTDGRTIPMIEALRPYARGYIGWSREVVKTKSGNSDVSC